MFFSIFNPADLIICVSHHFLLSFSITVFVFYSYLTYTSLFSACPPFLHGRWSVGVPQHGLQAACKVVGEDARIVLTMGHERDNAQQQQHQSLDGQGGAQNTAHEPVAARQDVCV